MPNIASAAKRVRSDAKKRAHNQSVVSELKTLSKKLAAHTKENLAEAKKLSQTLLVKYDKAVKMGIIPRGRADRRKSRVSLFVNKLAAL